MCIGTVSIVRMFYVVTLEYVVLMSYFSSC